MKSQNLNLMISRGIWILVMVLAIFDGQTLPAETNPIALKALTNEENWIAGFNIPFRLENISLSKTTPVKKEIVSGSLNKNDCLIIQDPFVPNNFLLRCLKSGTVSVKITIDPPTISNPFPKSTIISTPAISIHSLNGFKIADSFVNQDYILGKGLYNSNCGSCHGYNDQTDRKGRSLGEITNAIESNSGMAVSKGLLKQLSQEQLQKIVLYLENPK